MRHTPRVPTPRRFQALVDSHPGADWKLIDSAAKEEIQAALLPAQDYVCAYCERPLRWAGGPFRETPEKTEHLVSTLHIEHFHPQNPDSNVPCMIHPSDYSLISIGKTCSPFAMGIKVTAAMENCRIQLWQGAGSSCILLISLRGAGLPVTQRAKSRLHARAQIP